MTDPLDRFPRTFADYAGGETLAMTATAAFDPALMHRMRVRMEARAAARAAGTGIYAPETTAAPTGVTAGPVRPVPAPSRPAHAKAPTKAPTKATGTPTAAPSRPIPSKPAPVAALPKKGPAPMPKKPTGSKSPPTRVELEATEKSLARTLVVALEAGDRALYAEALAVRSNVLLEIYRLDAARDAKTSVAAAMGTGKPPALVERRHGAVYFPAAGAAAHANKTTRRSL